MKVKELKEILNHVNEDAEVCVTNQDQDNTYNIEEASWCEDHSSKYYKTYVDLVIKI